MAANDTNTSNIPSLEQANANVPTNVMPALSPPGAILPYSLRLFNDIEEPFEPISFYAIMESGQYGPVASEQLKAFLRRKLDNRRMNSIEVVNEYTDNIAGFCTQLVHLDNRMDQIKKYEKIRTKSVNDRIKDLEKALKDNKPWPEFYPFGMELSMAAEEAFRFFGSDSEGPLNEAELRAFINNGVHPGKPNGELLQQLQALRLRIYDNVDIEKHKMILPYQRVQRAIKDIVNEIHLGLPRSTRR